jgi:hypothetical protein
VYFTVTFKPFEIVVAVFTLSVVAIDNFETGVVQKFAEFFSRI